MNRFGNKHKKLLGNKLLHLVREELRMTIKRRPKQWRHQFISLGRKLVSDYLWNYPQSYIPLYYKYIFMDTSAH